MIHKAYPRITFGMKTFGYQLGTKNLIFDSIFVLVHDLYDEVIIAPDTKLTIKYYDHHNQSIVPPYDLVSEVLLFLQTKYSLNIKAKIAIKKNIPFGSGLSSSASCAAVVLKYFLDQEKLSVNFYDLATKIHHALPFFLTGLTIARVQNLGNQIILLSNIQLPKMKVYLTGFTSNKENLFKNYHQISDQVSGNMINEIIANLNKKQKFLVTNELQNIILKSNPDLAFKKMFLSSQYNQIFLSGTGTTIVEVLWPQNKPLFYNSYTTK